MMNRILIVAAHPDDDILGCGGMLAKYSMSSVDFRVIYIGEGTTCRFNNKDINSERAKKEIAARNEYGVKALQLLNIDSYNFYNLPCGRFDQVPLIEIGKIIEKEINEFKPDSIFTHSLNDTHIDHARTFQAALQATRPRAQNFISKLYSFEVLSSSEWKFVDAFKPNYFISLREEDVKLKIKALEQYNTEIKNFPFPRSKEGILISAKYRGMQAGTLYAEAYRVIREIVL